MNDGRTADLFCIGMALVDSIIRGFDLAPLSATGYRAVSGDLCVGGEAVNVSVAASRLGLRAAILCSLGRDGAGDLVAQTLRENGVDTVGILRSADHPTPVTTMFVNEDGTRRSITNEAHRYNFHPGHRPGIAVPGAVRRSCGDISRAAHCQRRGGADLCRHEAAQFPRPASG